MHAAELRDYDTASAWHYLEACAGLDLGGCDTKFDKEVLYRIAPAHPSIEAALPETDPDALLEAFFDTAQRHILVADEIVSFLENSAAANARQIKAVLAAAERPPLDAQTLKNQALQWRQVASLFTAPALDPTGAWRLHTLICNDARVRAVLRQFQNGSNDKPKWLQSWLRTFEEGRFPGLPAELMPERWPIYLQPAIAFIAAALLKVHALKMSRQELFALWQAHGFPNSPDDALHLWNLAQHDAEGFFRKAVISLVALQRASIDQLIRIGYDTRQITDRYGKVVVSPKLTLNRIGELLTLPLWKRRHELYGMWVAMEAISALKGHAFRISRTDRYYELCRAQASLPNDCILAIECARRIDRTSQAFYRSLEEYALAVPTAQIYVVDYHSLSHLRNALTPQIFRHCVALPYLTPGNTIARQVLQHAIRQATESGNEP